MIGWKYLQAACYLVAICELLHATYFVVQDIIWLVEETTVAMVFALLGTLCWLAVSIMLIVGIYKRKTMLLRLWLMFATIGFALDVALLFYDIIITPIEWKNIMAHMVLFIADVLEACCIFVVYLFYKYLVCNTLTKSEEKEAETAGSDTSGGNKSGNVVGLQFSNSADGACAGKYCNPFRKTLQGSRSPRSINLRNVVSDKNLKPILASKKRRTTT